MKYRWLAGVSALLIFTPLVANAQDQALCQALNVIMPYAKSGFRGVTGPRIDKVSYSVTMNLPYAHSCYMMPDKEDGNRYVCEFRVDASRDIQAEMTNFATNITACRPDLKSSDYSNNGDRIISLDSEQADISVSFNSSYAHEFNVYIYHEK